MDDDADRSSILKRRGAFIAAALAGLAASTTNCGGKVVFVDDDGSGAEAQGGAGGEGAGGVPQPCLGAPLGGEGGMPQPCLEAPLGGGGSFAEGGARPCLTPQ